MLAMFFIHIRPTDLWILPFSVMQLSVFFFQIIGIKLSRFSCIGLEKMFSPNFQDSSFAVYD